MKWLAPRHDRSPHTRAFYVASTCAFPLFVSQGVPRFHQASSYGAFGFAKVRGQFIEGIASPTHQQGFTVVGLHVLEGTHCLFDCAVVARLGVSLLRVGYLVSKVI